MFKKNESVFPIFKTITIGVYKSVKAYREALVNAGFRISGSSNTLNHIQMSQSEIQLDLVIQSVAELGFKEATRLDQIYARAKEFGLELCPSEVGPALCLAYLDQPNGEWLRVAMEPISGLDGFFSIFRVDHNDDDRWLRNIYDSPDDLLDLGYRFVFILSR